MARNKTIWIAGIGAIAIIAVLYMADPATTAWSPKCLMLSLTGYKCPGCGIQRMMHHLLHGELAAAIRYNYFAALIMPFLIMLGIGLLFPDTRMGRFSNRYIANKYTGFAYITLYIAWWIARNVLNI